MRALLLLLGLSACGDPLATGEFTGDVKLKFQAIVCGEQSHDIVPDRPRLGVLWRSDVGNAVSDVTAVSSSGFPQAVEMEIFDRPPILATHGCPMLFDDLDGDEAFSDGDPILAVSWNQLLEFYADEYRLQEGVCREDGTPTGELADFRDRPVDVSFLEGPDDFETPPPGSCTQFF